MDCQIKRNSQGKIVEVAGNNPTFKNILNNTPTLSLEEAIEVYKHTLKSPELIKKAIERNNGNPLNLAPNGKPSLLYQSYIDLGYNAQEAERLTAQVYSDEFKVWFGDWQNAPEESSKVVDSNGMPLVVYHGTNAEFTVFDTSEEGVLGRKGNIWDAEYPEGYTFFTSSYKDAKYYGQNILSSFLNLLYIEKRKVKKGESLVKPFDDEGLAFEGDAMVTDGVNYIVGTTDDYAIKSATDNIGTFSNETNDIRFQILGERGAQSLDQAEEVTFRMNNLLIAKDMEKVEKTPKEIRLATGWERGADSLWRYEIEEVVVKDVEVELNKEYSFLDIVEADTLKKAYPQIKDLKIIINDKNRTLFDRVGNKIEISSKYITNSLFPSSKSATNIEEMFGARLFRLRQGNNRVLSHEATHYIQLQEGFHRGGSTAALFTEADILSGVEETDSDAVRFDKYTKLIEKKEDYTGSNRKIIDALERFYKGDGSVPTEVYKRLAGEVEARNVEDRLNMAPKQRRQTLLQETEDVAREDQIFLRDGMGEAMHTPPAKEIEEQLINTLKKNGLSTNVVLLNTNEINKKLQELGVDAETRKQVLAWHGSPHSFDRFTTEKMGTREGAQAFGWGLYFTDLESIAKNYAEKLAKSKMTIITDGKEIDLDSGEFTNAEEIAYGTLEVDYTIEKAIKRLEYNQSKRPNEDNLKAIDILKRTKVEGNRNLYKVSLHKGKEVGEYTWLEWDKKLSDINQDKINKQFSKDNLPKEVSSSLNETMKLLGKESNFKTYRPNPISGTVEQFYQDLVRYFLDSGINNPQKEASLFLLRAGIDGIKYPAESISRGATSDTARGFNYVVFDENAITIEEQLQFQKQLSENGIALTTKGFVDLKTKEIYLNKDLATNETLLHEYSHLFNAYTKQNHPELYKRGIALVKEQTEKENSEIKEIVEYVKQTQPSLEGEALYEEILTEFTARTTDEMLEKSGGIFEWLRSFWENLKGLLGITQMSVEEVYKLDLKSYAEAVGRDLLRGEDFTGINGEINFNRWKEENRLVSSSDIQDVKTGEPIVAKVYHGTTNEFYEFDSSVKGNIEGHLGKVNYFTSDYQDASSNYGAEGADITGRIDSRQDELENNLRFKYTNTEEGIVFQEIIDDYNITQDEIDSLYPNGQPYFVSEEEISRFLAEKELLGGNEQVLELYVKLNNPVVLGNGTTWFDALEIDEVYLEEATQEIAEENDITEEEAKDEYSWEIKERAIEKQGEGNKIVESLERALRDNRYDGRQAIDILGDNYYEEVVDLNSLEKSIRSAELYDNFEGELAGSQVISDFFKNLGFDGIILTDVSNRFRGMRLGEGTSHIHVFDEYNNQIKLADGRNVTFNENTSDIRYQQAKLEFKTNDGQTFLTYKEALQNSKDNEFIDVILNNEKVASLTATTANNSFEGVVNDLIKSNILSGERTLDTDGNIYYKPQGNSEVLKTINASIADTHLRTFIGHSNYKWMSDNTLRIEKPQEGQKAPKTMEMAAQLYNDLTAPFGDKRVLMEAVEITPQNELEKALLSLLEAMGVSTSVVEKFNDLSVNALADIANRIVAFKNGEISTELLSEETAHFIVEALPQAEIENLLRNVDKTPQWEQYSEQYMEKYGDENLVRREVLGKILKDAFVNKFNAENKPEIEQRFYNKLLQLFTDFINRVRAYFTPQNEQQLADFTEKVYRNLLAGDLINQMDLNQLEGNKIALFNAGNDLSTKEGLLYANARKTVELLTAQDRKLSTS
jgi:hypothetical protein